MDEKNQDLLVKDAYTLRGCVVNESIFCERMVDEFLSNYFCSDIKKKKDIMELLLCTDRITSENKRQVLKKIVENNHKDFSDKYPSLFSDMLKLYEERNIMAHYMLDTSENGIKAYRDEQKIGFVNFKIKGKLKEAHTVWYDMNKVSAIIKLADKCKMTIIELNDIFK